MSFIRSKAFEFDNGYIGSGGVWFTSGPDVPTHSAEFGDRFHRTTNGEHYKNTSSPSPGTIWTLIFEGVGSFPPIVWNDDLGHVLNDDLCPLTTT